MTVATNEAPALTGNKLTDVVTRFLDEALNGPVYSGLDESVTVNGVTVELSASRDWGVRFSRTLPDGEIVHRHIVGDDLTLEGAARAYAAVITA